MREQIANGDIALRASLQDARAGDAHVEVLAIGLQFASSWAGTFACSSCCVWSPRLRPLYEWIRELHRDNFRLPVMVVAEWVERSSDARSAERALIERCLRRGSALLNVEAERAGPQIPLF